MSSLNRKDLSALKWGIHQAEIWLGACIPGTPEYQVHRNKVEAARRAYDKVQADWRAATQDKP